MKTKKIIYMLLTCFFGLVFALHAQKIQANESDQVQKNEKMLQLTESMKDAADRQAEAADRQANAAWVQAVGSIAAVLVAVWVMHQQYRNTQRLNREKRDEDVRTLLRGIRNEILGSFSGLSEYFEYKIPEIKEKKRLNHTIIIDDRNIDLLFGFLEKASSVEDVLLMTQVCNAIRSQINFISAIYENNRLVTEFLDLQKEMTLSGNRQNNDMLVAAADNVSKFTPQLLGGYKYMKNWSVFITNRVKIDGTIDLEYTQSEPEGYKYVEVSDI